MTHLDLNDAQLEILARCYADAIVPLDRLPYSKEFELLLERFRERGGVDIDRQSIWRALCNLRKSRRLVRKLR